jgi:hypothetical protein
MAAFLRVRPPCDLDKTKTSLRSAVVFQDRFTDGDQNNNLYFTDEGWAGGLVFAYWNANVRQFLIDHASAFMKEYRIDPSPRDPSPRDLPVMTSESFVA